jgi:hypothetical protein
VAKKHFEVDADYPREARLMVLYGLCYEAIGVALVFASYATDGWPRWPLAILGWFLLVAGTWTLLFRVFLGFLVTALRRFDKSLRDPRAK